MICRNGLLEILFLNEIESNSVKGKASVRTMTGRKYTSIHCYDI